MEQPKPIQRDNWEGCDPGPWEADYGNLWAIIARAPDGAGYVGTVERRGKEPTDCLHFGKYATFSEAQEACEEAVQRHSSGRGGD